MSKILSTEERIQEILHNPRIHPFKKHLKVSRILRTKDAFEGWTFEEQDILSMHGIDLNQQLVESDIPKLCK